jgi:hypothetical protein
MKLNMLHSLALSLAICAVHAGPALSQAYSADKAMGYFQAHDWNQLIPYLNSWAKAAPNDAMPWYYLGTSYGSKSHGIGMERPEDARIAFKKAVALKPNFPKAWNALGFTEIELETTLVRLLRLNTPPNKPQQMQATGTASAAHTQN